MLTKQYLKLWQFNRARLLKFLASKWQFEVINSSHKSRKEKTYAFWGYLSLPFVIQQQHFFRM